MTATMSDRRLIEDYLPLDALNVIGYGRSDRPARS